MAKNNEKDFDAHWDAESKKLLDTLGKNVKASSTLQDAASTFARIYTAVASANYSDNELLMADLEQLFDTFNSVTMTEIEEKLEMDVDKADKLAESGPLLGIIAAHERAELILNGHADVANLVPGPNLIREILRHTLAPVSKKRAEQLTRQAINRDDADLATLGGTPDADSDKTLWDAWQDLKG